MAAILPKSSSQSRKRKQKRIPLHIVEDHNDALEFIYSAIGSKKLPLNANTILHFDSHPDLLLPSKLKGETARSGRKILDHIQIENWILPAVAAGYINHVVWIRPPWSTQLEDGARFFSVGEDPETGFLKVDAQEVYFLSDALYCNKLNFAQKTQLTVTTLDNLDLALIQSPYILDIDLDYITVNDPFEDLYKDANLSRSLEKIYTFKDPTSDNPEDWMKVNDQREKQLNILESLFKHLDKHNNLDNWPQEKTNNLETFQNVLQIYESVEKAYPNEKIDWLLIHDAGCTRDHGGLPKHISSEKEEKDMVEKMGELLKKLPQPAVVTIARSTEDDYCPKSAVERVQNDIVKMLKNSFDMDEPMLHYLSVE